MNNNHSCHESVKSVIEAIPGVNCIEEMMIRNSLIERISFNYRALGRLVMNRLRVEDAVALYDFYFKGLSKESRRIFSTYPLLSPLPNSARELSNRIVDWKREDDWTFLKLLSGEHMIGVCLLKRFNTERPVNGFAVREEFRNIGLGFLLQMVVNEQARLLGLERLYATAAPDNAASLRVHKKCGFELTGRLIPHFGYKGKTKEVDRYDIEMVVEFNKG